MDGALAELDRAAQEIEGDDWLVDEGITQADVTVACAFTFIDQALTVPAGAASALRRHVARCERLPAFKSVRLDFVPPVPAA
jgi:glutathione S-transferase